MSRILAIRQKELAAATRGNVSVGSVRWFPILVLAAGCGRISFRDTPPDAAPDTAADASGPPPIAPCADSYTAMYGQSRYRLVPAALPWNEAEQACEADGRGMHLVQLDDSPERGAIETFLMGTVTWVGITDRITDGKFLNVTGTSPLFMPWRQNDPSLAGPGCIQFDPSARTYHDVACATTLAYVCECDETAAKSGSF